MKKTAWIILLVTASVFTCFGQQINTAKLDSLLNILSSKGLANGSLAIAKNGKMVYQKAIGYSYIDSSKKIPADIHTKYRIGSATKMLTATMIFQLAEEGKLGLNQKLAIYFPDLPNANKITLQNMLYHRSGLHDYTHDTDFPSWMDKPTTHEALLKIIKDKGSDFEPGTKADYSNSNYLLLGYIIEKICKMPYAAAVRQRIIGKINLKETYYGKPINIADNESVSYKFGNGKWNTEKQTDLSIHGGAGAMVSTPADLVKFIDALFTGKLISKESLSKMETTIDDYGMGMFTNKYGDKPSFGHNGRVEEFYTAAWYLPAEKLSFAYCTNGIGYPRSDLLDGVLKICFDEPFTIPFGKTDTKPKDLDSYLGKYSNDQLTVNCTKDGNRLLLETRGTSFEVEKISDNYFMSAANAYFFQFNPDKGELQIKETDNVYYLKKVK